MPLTELDYTSRPFGFDANTLDESSSAPPQQ